MIEPATSRRVVVVSMMLTGAILVIAGARRGRLPQPRNLIGLGFVYVILATLADTAPQLAAPFAGLVAVTTALVDGQVALQGVSAAESGATRLGEADPIARQATAFVAAGGNNLDGQPSPQAERAVRFAAAQARMHVPYVWGGNSHAEGFDCSGLCQASYRVAGVSIPRTAQEQHDAPFPPVALGDLIPGDLVFSSFGGESGVGHVVMYAGDQRCVAAPHSGATVQFEPLSTFTAPGTYKGANRPAPTPATSRLATQHR